MKNKIKKTQKTLNDLWNKKNKIAVLIDLVSPDAPILTNSINKNSNISSVNQEIINNLNMNPKVNMYIFRFIIEDFCIINYLQKRFNHQDIQIDELEIIINNLIQTYKLDILEQVLKTIK